MSEGELPSRLLALARRDLRERERPSQEAYNQVFGPFDRGEFSELTDQEWQALIDGKRKSPHDHQSLALPPKGQGG